MTENKILCNAISHSIIDYFGVFTLFFRKQEKEKFLYSLVKFHFNEIIFIDKNGFIMQGNVEMSKQPNPNSKNQFKPQHMQIKYDFQSQQFQEVINCANGKIMEKGVLNLIKNDNLDMNNSGKKDYKISEAIQKLYEIYSAADFPKITPMENPEEYLKNHGYITFEEFIEKVGKL